jgi:hypothetical protein
MPSPNLLTRCALRREKQGTAVFTLLLSTIRATVGIPAESKSLQKTKTALVDLQVLEITGKHQGNPWKSLQKKCAVLKSSAKKAKKFSGGATFPDRVGLVPAPLVQRPRLGGAEASRFNPVLQSR